MRRTSSDLKRGNATAKYDGGLVTIAQAAARMTMTLEAFNSWLKSSGVDVHEGDKVLWKDVKRKAEAKK